MLHPHAGRQLRQRRTAIALARTLKPTPYFSIQAGLITIAAQVGAVILFAGIIQMLVWWLGR